MFHDHSCTYILGSCLFNTRAYTGQSVVAKDPEVSKMDAIAHRKRLLLRVLKSRTEYLVFTGAVNGTVQLLVFLFCDGDTGKGS